MWQILEACWACALVLVSFLELKYCIGVAVFVVEDSFKLSFWILLSLFVLMCLYNFNLQIKSLTISAFSLRLTQFCTKVYKVLYSFIIDTYKEDLNCTLCCRAQLDKRDNFFSNYQHFVFFYYQFNWHFRGRSHVYSLLPSTIGQKISFFSNYTNQHLVSSSSVSHFFYSALYTFAFKI